MLHKWVDFYNWNYSQSYQLTGSITHICIVCFQVVVDGNVLAFLDPAALISLRLSNPRHTHGFDRAPRNSYDKQGTKGITTQSTGFL